MQQGTIARIMDKGFGFIQIPGQEKDVFFHANALVNVAFEDLQVGDAVEFDVEEGQKGPQAANVNRIEGGSAAPAMETPAEAPAMDDAPAAE